MSMEKSFLIVLTFIYFGCHSMDPFASSEVVDKVIIIEDPFSFNRDSIEIDDFKINEIYINADLLTLNVSYGGGCKEHTFQLYATRGIYKSNPPQADVFLSHNGHGDFCEAYISENIKFDLSPMHAPVYLRIHLYRASEPLYPLILYRVPVP
jgi:hypothetical protein